MLKFEPFSIETLNKALPIINREGISCSDFSAGFMFMWQEGTDTEICIRNDTLVIRQNKGEQPAFSLPMGKEKDEMTDELIIYARENHLPLRFFGVDEQSLERIKADSRLNNAMWAYDPRWSDYIYSFEEAKNFSGKKFGGQRNHINKFRKLYGEPVVRFLMPDDVEAVEKMLSEYKAEHLDANKLETLELKQTEKLLSVYSTLGMYAAGLFSDGKIIAFSIGEVVSDVLFIHVEKALKRYEGVYPTMYSGFVRLMDSLPGLNLKTINREDDSGDMGLRTSKMQYHPIGQVNKYLVHVNSPANKLSHIPSVTSDNIVLTAFKETDKKAYLDLNTDVENNVYWGYDYRQDASITGPIDENTFFNSATFDMQVGDSINFAVRLQSNDEMIGEVILWNFNSKGLAELGCRLLPKYQGYGYGKEAFKAAADFAEKELQLKVYARCFKENLPSYKMILSSGFEPDFETETQVYFKRKSI